MDNSLTLARPEFTKKAVLRDAKHLRSRVSGSNDSIAAGAKCHANTVGSALSGKTMLYMKAHDVFTSVNQIASDFFDRADFVYFVDENEDQCRDDELKKCRVIPDIKDLVRSTKLTEEILSEKSGVHRLIVDDILQRRPTDKSQVHAIFEQLKQVDTSLDEAKSIIR